MEIATTLHKSLRKMAETGNTKGVIEPNRVRNMLLFIDGAENFDELATPPNFGFHPLTGDRAGTFAMTVTKTGG